MLFCYGIFSQLKKYTVTVLEKNNIDVILDVIYAKDTLNSLSEQIKVVNHYSEADLYVNCFTYSKLMLEL